MVHIKTWWKKFKLNVDPKSDWDSFANHEYKGRIEEEDKYRKAIIVI